MFRRYPAPLPGSSRVPLTAPRSGRSQGGTPFSRGQIHAILTNPVYRGLIRHKDQTFPGMHPAIVDEDLWQKVQTKLQAASAQRRGAVQNHGSSAPLLGKFRDETGERLTPTHSNKNGRRIRYYVSNGLVSGRRRPDAWRLPAQQFENTVAEAIAEHVAQHAKRRSVLQSGSAIAMETASQNAASLVRQITQSGIHAVSDCISSGAINQDNIEIMLDDISLAGALGARPEDLNPELTTIKARFTCRRRGQETRIVAAEARPDPDQTLIKALRHAHAWAEDLKSGTPIKDIARNYDCSGSYARRMIALATLSPKLQRAILDGTLPCHITLETFIRADIPLDWHHQDTRFGVAF